MPSLDSVLASIPGYAGFLAKRRYNEQGAANEMQQATGLMQIIGAAQKRQQEQQAAQKAAAYDAAIKGLPADATEDQILAVARPHMSADQLGKMITSSRDRQASQDIARQSAADRRDQQKALIDLRYDTLAQRAVDEEAKRKIEQQRADDKREADRRHDETIRLIGATRAAALEDRSPPVAVMGPDGKPVLVPRRESFGRTPANAPSEKPMPAPALRMQQEEIDAIGTAGAIKADLAAVRKQIEEGTLKLGFFRNMQSEGRQFLGVNDEASRQYGTFKNTLEKLRNDSLRLNKGVQTEGDAVRAWNEILTRINDPVFVRQRLDEVERINERAIALRRMNIDVIRRNYGHDPLDTSAQTAQPAAIGQGTPTAAPTGFQKGQTATGPNGQKIEWDGSKWVPKQ